MLGLSATQPGLALSWADWLWLAAGLLVTCAVLGAVLYWSIQESKAGPSQRDAAAPPPAPPANDKG